MAHYLNIPEFRVTIIAAVRRMLSIEGYAVIALDEGAKTVTMNYELLRPQFEPGEERTDSVERGHAPE